MAFERRKACEACRVSLALPPTLKGLNFLAGSAEENEARLTT